MEKTDIAVASLIEKLQDAGFEQAPEIIDGTLRAIYADGIMSLMFIGLFTGILLISLVLLTQSKTQKIGVIGTLVGLPNLIIWSASNPYLKVFDPAASFYQDVMNKVL
jgi:hypothetical protein